MLKSFNRSVSTTGRFATAPLTALTVQTKQTVMWSVEMSSSGAVTTGALRPVRGAMVTKTVTMTRTTVLCPRWRQQPPARSPLQRRRMSASLTWWRRPPPGLRPRLRRSRWSRLLRQGAGRSVTSPVPRSVSSLGPSCHLAVIADVPARLWGQRSHLQQLLPPQAGQLSEKHQHPGKAVKAATWLSSPSGGSRGRLSARPGAQ